MEVLDAEGGIAGVTDSWWGSGNEPENGRLTPDLDR